MRLPLRRGVRAIVLDPDDRILLVRFQHGEETWWAPPGGGVEPGETDEHALERELAEECGLRGCRLGTCIWTREHVFEGMAGFGGQRERLYLVRTDRFEPAPEWTAEQLASEGMVEQRWWTLGELERSDAVFAPRRLAPLLRALLREGPPRAPVDVGV
jgi:ADP-ribose pyrophosphatase YjhB (NUDIX family)